MTFAFGINKGFLNVYEKGAAPLRYALMEKLLGPGVTKEKRKAAEAEMRRLRAKKQKGDDPIVVTGSANFSDASTTQNDANMLVIRGNKRAADVYLGEYMRFWNHYAFREWAEKQDAPLQTEFKHLDVENKWWRAYFGDTERSHQREYFSG